MKRILLVSITLLFIGSAVLRADQGMWLPMEIHKNISQLRKAGLKLSAEDIYSINKACLKDAVIGLTTTDYSFDSFCSASFISDQGLVVTNYHPMIRYLEMLSNKDRDFLKFGYWAQSKEEESNCFGLQVSQLVQMIDVTDELLSGISDTLEIRDKNTLINKRGQTIVSRHTKGTHYEGQITSFMGGNQYVLSLYRIYKDVRMVAAPPMVLGKYAGDDDNWQWPRQTADFSLLRVYVNEKNEPTKYNKSNVPLTGNAFLKISTKGVKENDFVMTMGFPAHTKLYIPSFAIEYMQQQELPAKIHIRGEKIRIINEAIAANPDIKFRYTSRVNSMTNNYLRWKGELSGLEKMNLTASKQKEEEELAAWINSDPARLQKYGDVMTKQAEIYQELIPYKIADLYFNEAGLNGAEVVPFAGKFEKLVQMFNRTKLNEKAVAGEVERLKPLSAQFYGGWDYQVDLQMYRDMLYLYFENVDRTFVSKQMVDALAAFDGDVTAYATDAFERSIITHPERMNEFLANVDSTSIRQFVSDPVYQLSISYYRVYTDRIALKMKQLQEQQAKYFNTYMQAYAEKNKDKGMSPDANQTQRLTYGHVKSYTVNGTTYPTATTLDDLFAKQLLHDGNPDYYIPRKIRELYEKRHFGRFAHKGTVPLCFISDCHTTSANSGSPVLNANGHLVGLNFDRVVDGVASDYAYLPELSRNIILDIRYMLFLLEQYAPTKYVLTELKFVNK